jgi:hypothetical protein
MTPQLDAYLEIGVGAHVDNAVVAWAFDLDLWGTCGQGLQETAAVAALADAAARPRHRPTRRCGRADPRR